MHTKIVESKEEDAVCCLSVPNNLLRYWYTAKDGTSYVERLNESIIGHSVLLKYSAKLEERIRVKSYRINRKIEQEKTNKKKKRKIMSQFSRITIYIGETVDIKELMEETIAHYELYDEFRYIHVSNIIFQVIQH